MTELGKADFSVNPEKAFFSASFPKTASYALKFVITDACNLPHSEQIP